MDRRYKQLRQGLIGDCDFQTTDLNDGETITWDAASGKWTASVPSSGGGGGGTTFGSWRWRGASLDVDPTDGRMTGDVDDLELLTELYISAVNSDGVNVTNLFGVLTSGDFMYIQDPADPSAAALYELTGLTDNGTYWTVNVTLDDAASGDWAFNTLLGMIVVRSGSTTINTAANYTWTGEHAWQNDGSAHVYLDSDGVGAGNTTTLSFRRNTDDRFYMNYRASNWRSVAGMDFRYTSGVGSTELLSITEGGRWDWTHPSVPETDQTSLRLDDRITAYVDMDLHSWVESGTERSPRINFSGYESGTQREFHLWIATDGQLELTGASGPEQSIREYEENGNCYFNYYDSGKETWAQFTIADGFQVNADVGFYGTTPVAQQTGVAVTAGAIHTALVNLGLITA